LRLTSYRINMRELGVDRENAFVAAVPGFFSQMPQFSIL
jgi:hypothetical protein